MSQNELTNEEIHYIFTQLITALSYLHNQSIIHNDFNVENVLINPKTKNIKIIDFGVSKKINEKDSQIQSIMDHQGNIMYRAPRGYTQESGNCYFNDYWGLCLIVLSLVRKEALSSKKAVKLRLIDEKKIEKMVLNEFTEENKKNEKMDDFFGFGKLKIRVA